MNNSIKSIVFILVVLASMESEATLHKAQSDKHWTIGGTIGTPFSVNGDTSIPSIFGKPPLKAEPVYKTGYQLGIDLGLQIQKWLLCEAELTYQKLPFETINNAIGAGTVTAVKSSGTTVKSLFLNGIIQLDLEQEWLPYLGLGAGFVSVKNKIEPSTPIPVTSTLFFTDKDINYNTFGYQAKLGVLHQFNENLLFDLHYKYFSTRNGHVVAYTNLGPDGYQTTQKIVSHSVLLGIKYFI